MAGATPGLARRPLHRACTPGPRHRPGGFSPYPRPRYLRKESPAHHPQTLTKLSGDEQEGPAGAPLSEPFVVEVRDQNNNPLEGAQVAFFVTSGGGALSVAIDTTDANGRASVILTLGSNPGKNTVEARVAGLESQIFGASGQDIPRTLAKLSGDEQQGPAGSRLKHPFVVTVLDQDGDPVAGATVTFTVTSGEGNLSVFTDTTDANGHASTLLTLGRELGTNSVTVSVAGLDPVNFTAIAEVTPDFDGDGKVGLLDFFRWVEAFGGTDPRFDLNGNGTVDFGDFFILADHIGGPERSKLLALAREMIGLPDGPQLLQNTPNPFNGSAAIGFILPQDAAAELSIYNLAGQKIATLAEGFHSSGTHTVLWYGRDETGGEVSSGVYIYRLQTETGSQTRKLVVVR